MKNYQLLLFAGLLLYNLGSSFSQNKDILVAQNGRVERAHPADHRYAFIVGNDHYQDMSISSLSSCRLDAVRFGAFLKSGSGWDLPKGNISLLLDATQEEVKKGLQRVLTQMDDPQQSTLYFYYSGHGVPGGMVPVDFTSEQPESLISYAWIKETIQRHGIRAQVFVIDACYSGSIIDMKDAVDFNRIYQHLMQEEGDNAMAVFTAANAYRVTPAGRHESLYTKYFIQAIDNASTDQNQDGVLTAKEVYQSIEASIGDLSSPQFAGNQNFPMAKVHASHTQTETAANFSLSLNQQPTMVVQESDVSVLWRESVHTMAQQPEAMQKLIVQLQQENSAEAQARLGFIHREGLGVTKDINKALNYFVSAASRGNRFAEYNLGYLYSRGMGLEQDKEKALQYYIKAAEKGDPFAQNNLGAIYANKATSHYDFKKAVAWFSLSATQGYTHAQIALATLYKQKGEWTKNPKKKQGWYEKAVHWLDQAAQENHPDAQFELARCYEFGLGIEKNMEQSKFWYQQACDNNISRSCRKLMLLANL